MRKSVTRTSMQNWNSNQNLEPNEKKGNTSRTELEKEKKKCGTKQGTLS